MKLIDTKTLDVKIWDLNIAVSNDNVCIMGTVGKVEYEYVEVDAEDEDDDDNESEEVLENRSQRSAARNSTAQQPRSRLATRTVEASTAPQPPPDASRPAATPPVAPPPVLAPAPVADPNTEDDTYVNTFRYDIDSNTLVPLRCFKDEHVSAMTKCGDYIYAVCCSNEDVWWECEVKRYNPKTNKLKKVSSAQIEFLI